MISHDASAHWVALLAAVACFLPATSAADEPAGEQGTKHSLVVGLGGAAELELRDGSFNAGGNAMFE